MIVWTKYVVGLLVRIALILFVCNLSAILEIKTMQTLVGYQTWRNLAPLNQVEYVKFPLVNFSTIEIRKFLGG